MTDRTHRYWIGGKGEWHTDTTPPNWATTSDSTKPNLRSRLTPKQPTPRKRRFDPNGTAAITAIVVTGLIVAILAVYISIANKVRCADVQTITIGHSLLLAGCR